MFSVMVGKVSYLSRRDDVVFATRTNSFNTFFCQTSIQRISRNKEFNFASNSKFFKEAYLLRLKDDFVLKSCQSVLLQ